MNWLNLSNCFAGTLLPPFVVYKCTKPGESYNSATMFKIFALYQGIQTLKLFLMATFLPGGDESDFTLSREITRALFSAIDLAGMKYMLGSIAGESDIRILAVGFGWAGSEAISRSLSWFSYQDLDFAWRLQEIVTANANIVLYVGLAALVWAGRRSQTKLTLALLLNSALHVLPGFLSHELGMGAWIHLAAYVGICVGIAAVGQGGLRLKSD